RPSLSKSVSTNVSSPPSSTRKACTWPPCRARGCESRALARSRRRAGAGALPRSEGILDALERRLERRKVAEQHGSHRVVLDPVDAFLRVHLGPVVTREEAVALEAPRGHQDEDAERGVAEAEPLRLP